jgi:23S rRNA (guanosine2251-2'-O)-methyltransferase
MWYALFFYFCQKFSMRKLSMDELNRLNQDEFSQISKLPVIIVLDNIRSLNNIGSFFRTADAFRVKNIFLCGITATPPHREIHKTALGATETVEWKYFEKVTDAISLLRSIGYQILCIEQTDESLPLWDYKPLEKTAFIFGNEVDGVSEDALSNCDASIEIPQEGTKHSLNVAVCGGIILWHFFRFINKG